MNKTRVAMAGLLALVVVQAAVLVWLLLPADAPGQALTVRATSAGVPLADAEGRFVVYRAGKHQQPYANGRLGRAVALEAGTYDLRVVLTGAAGAPTGWRTGVVLADGASVEAGVEVAVGELMVSADAPTSGVVMIQVFAEGQHDRVVSSPNVNERTLHAPGRYDVRAAYMIDTEEKAVRWVQGVEIVPGLLSAPAVSFPRSRLLLIAENNGRRLEPEAVEVNVYRAGDVMREIIESGFANLPIELNPGAYDVEARLLSAGDQPVRLVAGVELGDHGRGERRVAFDTATILTEASLTGGELLDEYDAYVYVYHPNDHEQAITYAPAGKPLMLSAGTYDLRASFFRSADQPDLWVRGVELSPGEERAVPFRFASGKLIVRAFDADGEELIGDNVVVRAYAGGTRNVPLATARGGELQVLSAGSYEIAVEDTRSAAVQWLEDIEVVAGELTEPMARTKSGPASGGTN